MSQGKHRVKHKLSFGIAGNTSIAGGQIAAGGKAGSGLPSLGAVAAIAPAPLAAAPEQALRAEVSETASEPDLLFAPDFIISQVRPSGVALTQLSDASICCVYLARSQQRLSLQTVYLAPYISRVYTDSSSSLVPLFLLARLMSTDVGNSAFESRKSFPPFLFTVLIMLLAIVLAIVLAIALVIALAAACIIVTHSNVSARSRNLSACKNKKPRNLRILICHFCHSKMVVVWTACAMWGI